MLPNIEKNQPEEINSVKTKLSLLFLVILGICLGIFSCEGPVGPEGPPGPPGPAGTVGPAGADGNLMLAGEGLPESDLGNAGDFYLDLATGDLYGPKDTQGWGEPSNLSGADGADGSQIFAGEGSPDEELGSTGDYYLDKTNYQLYGPKTEEGWGDPLNLQGPEGPSGPAGVSGWERIIVSETLLANSALTMDINCPEGKNVLGGGAFTFSGSFNFDMMEVYLVNSAPWGPSTWRIRVTNKNSLSAVTQGYAICAAIE